MYGITAIILAVMLMFGASSPAVSSVDLSTDEGEYAPAELGAVSPVITSIEPCREGLKVSWQAVSGVGRYRVYRWYSDGRGWVARQETDLLSYIDQNVVSGNTYRYRVVGISASGSVLTPTALLSFEYYALSQITSAECTANGIRISWTKDENIPSVALYRLTNGVWKHIVTSYGSSYLDKDVAQVGEYRYTVRAVSDSGVFLTDFFDEMGYSVTRCISPVLSAANAFGGVKVSWGAVEGAQAYRVFCKTDGGSWTRIGDTSDTSLLHTGAVSGQTYTYTVRCLSADGKSYTSYFDTTGKSVLYVASPVLLSADGSDSGVRISWQPSAGAVGYRVFRRNSSGGWSGLANTTATSYLDTTASAGTTYTYTVRCLNAAGTYASSFDDAGVSGRYLSAPVAAVSSGVDGVDIRWNAVSGAEKYRVYTYGAKGWTRLTDTAGMSYTDTEAVSGNTYTYTVRCINADATEFTSGFLSGKSVRYIAAPTVTVENTLDGMKISWTKSAGAEKYRLYTYRGGWVRLTDTTATSYIDKSVKSGAEATYTVRCLNAAATAFTSAFRPGVSNMRVSAPDFTLTRNDDSVTVGWNAVPGAELYRVYVRSGSTWLRLTDTTDTSYTDTTVISGGTYTYTVRCLNAEATTFTSGCPAGKSIKFVETPHITKAASVYEGVSLSWNAVGGAAKYRVFRKNGESWTRIGEITGTSFTDTQAVSGATNTYTVRCVNAAGSAFESSFDPIGVSVDYIAAPKDITAVCIGNSLKISWTPSDGAERYRVYYYEDNGWKKLTETTGSSVTDSSVISGRTYVYTVRCITADGTRFTSDFNRDGVSCTFVAVPSLTTPGLAKNGVILAWSKPDGAEKFRVYRKENGSWKRLTDTTAASVTDATVTSGNTYEYTVRCLSADAKRFTSDFDPTGVSIYYVAAPKMLDLEATPRFVKITWSQPAGAQNYRFYKKINGSWTRLADTASNSYTDTDVSVGSTYAYTVRVIDKDATRYESGFDPDGFIVTVVSNVSDFRYYDQTQYDYPYGDDTIAGSGCGPTAFAMVASTLTGKTVTPIDAVEWCGNNYYIYNAGTRWDYFGVAASRFGVKLESQVGAYEFDKVIAALKKGKLVISSQGAGRFTKGGHFIVLAGLDEKGKIIVFDPNGGNHFVGTSFTEDEITEAGTQYWIFDKK